MFMKKYCLTVILFVMLSVVFTTCDMDLFANKYLPSTLQGEVNVTIPPGPVTVGTTLTADYDGYEPVEFQWYRNGVPIPPPEGTKKTFTPTVAGTYTVGVKAPTRGEKRSAPIVVVGGHSTGTGDLTGTITRSPTGDLVSGFPITITYTPGTGETVNVSELTYEWLIETPPPAGNFVSVSTDNPYTPTTPGTYKIKVTDPSTGRTTEKILIIGNPPTPPLSGNVGITGSGKTGELLTATYSGGESPVTYEWWQELPPPAKPVSTSNSFTPTEAGRYVVVATVSGYNRKVSEPIIVTATGGLLGDVSLTNQPLTAGGTTTAAYIPASGESNNAGDYSYEWINPSGTVAGTNATSPTLTAGTWTVRVTGPDGRTFEKQITVGAGGIGAGLYTGSHTSTSTIDPRPTASGGHLVMAVTTDDHLNTAFTNHINSGTGEYTLLIDRPLDMTTNREFVANQRLTIIGVDDGHGEPSITFTGGASVRMFTINGTNSSLTLSNNFTLKGRELGSSEALIFVARGNLVMLDGSKIIGHNTTSHFGTVFLTGVNSSFTMEGGTITGNNISISGANDFYYVGGVTFENDSTFTMTGGSIIGNTRNDTLQRDIRCNWNTFPGYFNLSGNAQIGHLLLNHVTAGNTSITSTAEAFSGSIVHLYLLSGTANNIATARTNWNTRTVIGGTAGTIVAIRDRIVAASFMDNTGTLEDISPTHHINDSGVLTAGAGPITPPTGNLFLVGNSTPIMETTVAGAITYVNTNASAGAYILQMFDDCTINTPQRLNANARLMIESDGSTERILTSASTGFMFQVSGNSTTTFTLGNNITLVGNNISNRCMVYVGNGTFIMEDGSKITGHRNTSGPADESAAVYVFNNPNGTFIMRGGLITDNVSHFSSNVAVGGVQVAGTATFRMEGGEITGNRRSDGESRDILINFFAPSTTARFNLSGNTTIGHLIIQTDTAGTSNSRINGSSGSYSGTIQHLYLHSTAATNNISNTITNWLGTGGGGKTVIDGDNIIAIRNSISDVSFVPNTLNAVQSITHASSPHHICAGVPTTANAGRLRTGTSTACTDCP